MVCPYYTHAYELPQAKQGMQCNRIHTRDKRPEEAKRYEGARRKKEAGEEGTCTIAQRGPQATRYAEQDRPRQPPTKEPHEREQARRAPETKEGTEKSRGGAGISDTQPTPRLQTQRNCQQRPPHTLQGTVPQQGYRGGKKETTNEEAANTAERRMDGISLCHREKTRTYQKSKRYARCPQATATATYTLAI